MDRSQAVRNYVDMLQSMDRYGSYDYTVKAQLYAAEARDPSIGHEARAKYREMLKKE